MRCVVNKTKGTSTYMYKGDLEKEVQSCKKELEKKLNELPMYKLIKEKFDKEYASRQKRIEELKDFIILAEEELERRRKKKKEKNLKKEIKYGYYSN